MKNIDELIKNLIFSAAEISECFVSESKAVYWIKSSVNKERLAKIRMGLYALINPATGLIYADKFMLGSRINAGTYIAYHSALEFHGLANQVYNDVYVASTERFQGFEYGGITYERVQGTIPDGIITVKSSCDIRVTDLERTVIDCIDDTLRAGGAEELLNALSYIKRLNFEKLLKYLKAYDKKNMWQKTAYLLEKFNGALKLPDVFFAECKKHIGRRIIYFLNDGSYGATSQNNTWNIIAPVKLEAKE